MCCGKTTQWLSWQPEHSAPALKQLWRLTSGPPSTTFPALLVGGGSNNGDPLLQQKRLLSTLKESAQHHHRHSGESGEYHSLAHLNVPSPVRKAMDIEVQSLLKGKRNALPEIPAENKQDMTDLHSFHSPSVMFCLVIKILDIFYNVIICPNFSFVIY